MRIVVKVGTSTLAHPTGRLNIQRPKSEPQPQKAEAQTPKVEAPTPRVEAPIPQIAVPVAVAPKAEPKVEVSAPAVAERVEAAPEQPAHTSLKYRIVGELFNAYVVVELGEKMLLVDKHAAHERVIFERLKAGMKKGDRASQLLMLPLEVMLTSDEVSVIDEYRGEIEAVGF